MHYVRTTNVDVTPFFPSVCCPAGRWPRPLETEPECLKIENSGLTPARLSRVTLLIPSAIRLFSQFLTAVDIISKIVTGVRAPGSATQLRKRRIPSAARARSDSRSKDQR